MKTLPTLREEIEEEFEKEFGDLTLGILSGDEKSPVFINNELEKPRLKSFLSQAISRTAIAFAQDVLREANGEEKPNNTFFKNQTLFTRGYNYHHLEVEQRGKELLGNEK